MFSGGYAIAEQHVAGLAEAAAFDTGRIDAVAVEIQDEWIGLLDLLAGADAERRALVANRLEADAELFSVSVATLDVAAGTAGVAGPTPRLGMAGIAGVAP